MAWLNLNDSFSNIKGQITSFASGVLAEGIGDIDEDSKLAELQAVLESKEQEIQSLKKQNAELLQGSNTVNDNESANDDGWTSWDVPSPNTSKQPQNDQIVSDLKKKIEELENERKDFINSLEQLDLDCQQTTDKLVTMKDELQGEYNKLKVDYDDLKRKNEFLMKINDENQKKKNVVGEESYKNEIASLKDKIAKLLIVQQEYQNFKTDLGDYAKLESILQDYEKKVSDCEEEIASLNAHNSKLISQTEQISNLEQSRVQQDKELKVLKKKCEEYEKKILEVSQSKEKIVIGLNSEIEKLKNEILQLQNANSQEVRIDDSNEIAELKLQLSAGLEEKSKLHNKYVEILKESILNCGDFQLPSPDLSSQLSEYTTMVQGITKLVLDFKWKWETLSIEVQNLKAEKTNIITEKNHEIEKLIKNSEDLSKELMRKGQELKHYEEECAELVKNNEILILRLEDLKNSSGNLETISESNEENVVLLENQLEKSNKRIEELERLMNQGNKEEVLVSMQKQLCQTGDQLDLTQKQLHSLENNYKILESANDNLKHNLEDMKINYTECFNEKENLNTTVDQFKIDLENTEYKFAEQNINIETLNEEIETLKETIDSLSKENKKLSELNLDFEGKTELLQNEVEDLKQELTDQLESMDQKETERTNLIEKLQSVKMAETSLKLQYDTLIKEYNLLKDSNSKLMLGFDNTNVELLDIKNKFDELQKVNQELVELNSGLKLESLRFKESMESNINVQEILAEKNKLFEEKNGLEEVLREKDILIKDIREEVEKIREECNVVLQEKIKLEGDFANFKSSVAENNRMDDSSKISELQSQIAELNNIRNQLIHQIQEKHQENVSYYNEIQRLTQLLTLEAEKFKQLETQQNLNNSEEYKKKNEEIEKLTDQNNFLNEKCKILTDNLLQEQGKLQKLLAERSGPSEKEISLQKKLDSLRAHLIEVEDMYTKEVQIAEQKCEEMQTKLQEAEQREKHSSNRYTSNNIRANQQVETLQTQIQLVTNQRDEFKRKVTDYEDQIAKQSAAITNLQIVLQQFQREKDHDVYHETDRIRKQLAYEKDVQEGLRKEISELKSQLDESKQGLMAAVRLSDQVEVSKRQVAAMKEEVTKLQNELAKSEEKCNRLSNQTDGKVDKMLIKNLIIGLVATNNNLTKDQNQILKIISTVLDFNQQDIEKVNLNKNQQNSWFGSLLHPQGQNMSQESLSQAFVKFLEAESKPRVLPNLLESTPTVSNKEGESSNKTVRQSPILLNEVVLPTFADFGQSRNSSSILKDVLKDNTNR